MTSHRATEYTHACYQIDPPVLPRTWAKQEAVYLGAGEGVDTVPVAEDGPWHDEAADLDEKHVELRNDGGRLRARTTKPSNQASLRLPAAGQRNLHGPPLSLSSESMTRVPSGAKIILGCTRFTVQISGGAGPA